MNLNIGTWQRGSIVNGPGERFVLWLQGCHLCCDGCINDKFQPLSENILISVNEMAEKIVSTDGIEGVTFTGGEPTLQAHALTLLSEKIKPYGLSIVCYTGYSIEGLRNKRDRWIQKLLSLVDILIDGPFIQGSAKNLYLRGSTNQRIHFLTEKYSASTCIPSCERAQIELQMSSGNKISIVGNWEKNFIEKLEKKLNGE